MRVNTPHSAVLIFPQSDIKDFSLSHNIIKENRVLLRNLNIVVKKIFSFKLKKVNPSTYIGSGKIEEILTYCNENNVEIVVFLKNLSTAQRFKLQELFYPLILIDREEAIINIFLKNAHTKFAKIQAELAYLKYLLPQLRGKYNFSRTGGGIGTRGPGEQKLEMDKRYIQRRISYLTEKIKKRKTILIEQSKQRQQLFSVAIVGYTNSGKTTLLNQLTKAHGKILKRPFTTLDTLAKRRWLDDELIIIIDSIGFIRDLPKNLMEAFKSTISIINTASLIIKLFDLSAPHIGEQMKIVNDTLKNVLIKEIPTIQVFNKIDKNLAKIRLTAFKKLYPDDFFISAKKNMNIDTLINFLKKEKEFVKYKL